VFHEGDSGVGQLAVRLAGEIHCQALYELSISTRKASELMDSRIMMN